MQHRLGLIKPAEVRQLVGDFLLHAEVVGVDGSSSLEAGEGTGVIAALAGGPAEPKMRP
ncbi:hypothetical protein ACFQY9_16745 [Microvirga aerilata]|uniref:hypothetical protein n=1 Tax=Microvirga aerilata TaxID=670292 RepID=UPI0036289828